MKDTKLSAAPKPPKSVAYGLAAFKERHGLSTRDLSAICGGSGVLSKSSAARICQGTADIRFVEKIKPSIIEGLTHFLSTQKGLTHDAIKAELLTIFRPEDLLPMIAQRTALPFSVYSHFGLRRDPFALENDPRTLEQAFSTPALDALVTRLIDAILYQGFVAVVGDIGSGKTFLKKRLVETVGRNERTRLLWPKFANMERVHSSHIVSFLLESFEQPTRRSVVANQRALEEFLQHQTERGLRVALGFDECHHLSDATLTALKNFYELGAGYDRYLGVILFGQTRFSGRMQDYRFREMAERVELIEMPPLGRHAAGYLAHRVRLAGGDLDRLFDKAAVNRLAAQASTPLAIGNLANQALIRAHRAGERRVPADLINADDSDEPQVRAVRRAG